MFFFLAKFVFKFLQSLTAQFVVTLFVDLVLHGGLISILNRTYFCFSIQHSPQCPICDTNLDVKRLKTLCPNFTVSSMVEKMLGDSALKEESKRESLSQASDGGDQILQMIQVLS
jgi:hypothetical protein